MPFWKAKVIDHDKEGRESESGYYIAEPNVVLEQIDDNTANKSGGWISNLSGK